MADFPPAALWKEFGASLREPGFLVDVQEMLACDYGDPVALNRVAIHAEFAAANRELSPF